MCSAISAMGDGTLDITVCHTIVTNSGMVPAGGEADPLHD